MEIQAAIDAIYAAGLGGLINFSEGDFYISATIQTHRAISFECAEGAATIFWLTDGADCNMFELDWENDVGRAGPAYWRGLTFHGNNDNQTVASHCICVKSPMGNDLHLVYPRIYDFNGNVIRILSSVTTGCVFAYHGSLQRSEDDIVHIEDGAKGSFFAFHIGIGYSTIGSAIKNLSSDYQIGLHRVDCSNNGAYGIYISGGRLEAVDVDVNVNQEPGLYMVGGYADLNRFQANRNYKEGIYLNNPDYFRLSGGEALGNGRLLADTYSGIYLLDTSKAIIMGVTSIDHLETKTQKYGIELAGTTADCILMGNDLTRNSVGALYNGSSGANVIRDNIGYITENSGTAVLGGGTMTNGTGVVTGSPVTLAPGANTPTITQEGTFTINLPVGNVGTAETGNWVVTGSPVALVAGNNTITVEAGGGPGTITVTTASTEMTVTHGLATTPTRAFATMTSDPGAANAHWVSDKGTTTFKIKTKVAVSTQTTFDWRAVVGEGN